MEKKMTWESVKLSINGKVGVPMKILFKCLDTNGLRIIKVETSCGCTMGGWNDKEKLVEATFTPKSVPKHLTALGQYEYHTTNIVTVHYDNGAIENLTFTAHIS